MTITRNQLKDLETKIDRVFSRLGIDVDFTRHFLDRLNDDRNRKPISISELGMLFAKEYRKWGNVISRMPVSAEAVMKDLSSEINVPFVLKKDGDEKDLVAKTIMRKKNFRTSNKMLPVESHGRSHAEIIQEREKNKEEHFLVNMITNVNS